MGTLKRSYNWELVNHGSPPPSLLLALHCSTIVPSFLCFILHMGTLVLRYHIAIYHIHAHWCTSSPPITIQRPLASHFPRAMGMQRLKGAQNQSTTAPPRPPKRCWWRIMKVAPSWLSCALDQVGMSETRPTHCLHHLLGDKLNHVMPPYDDCRGGWIRLPGLGETLTSSKATNKYRKVEK